MYKFSKDVVFTDFVFAWLSTKFSSLKIKNYQLALCLLIGNFSEE